MPQRREFPYIWATWLSRLLTGERSCEWAIWFKAHFHSWDRQPSDFNLAQWQIEHTALLADTKDQFIDSGYQVSVEAQNSFRLNGRTAVLAGRPDLIIERGDHLLVVDVKSGQEHPSHVAQVMAYMYALPRALDQYRGAKFAGEIHYPSHIRRVPCGGVDQGFITNLATLIHRIASPTPPPRVPSAQECGFCDITAVDCPDRQDADDPANAGETTDF